MEFDLVPCPDCGSEAKLDEGRYIGTNQTYSHVHCTNPLCHLFRYTLHFRVDTPQERDRWAALCWNERYAGIVCDEHNRSKERMPERRAS